jgi:hypothetical protein
MTSKSDNPIFYMRDTPWRNPCNRQLCVVNWLVRKVHKYYDNWHDAEYDILLLKMLTGGCNVWTTEFVGDKKLEGVDMEATVPLKEKID